MESFLQNNKNNEKYLRRAELTEERLLEAVEMRVLRRVAGYTT
jgi:hypothetical protein